MNPLKWLLTKAEPTTKETTVTDITASDNATTATETVPVTTTTTTETTPVAESAPVVEVKTGVKDFEAAFSFVEQGVAQLGDAAKDELKALAQKYL